MKTLNSRAASVKGIAVIEVAAINERSTVGDIGVVVEEHSVAVPVPSPVIPAPTETAEEKPRPVKIDSGDRIPIWVRDNGIAVSEPRIVLRDVDHFRIGRLNNDGIVLSCHLLLFVAIQMASFLSLLAHGLHGIHYSLLLVGISVA